MVTVADIIALPAFKSIELVAPCDGAATRPVHNVGILDVSPEYNGYSVYLPGEFIVTNLGFANGDPQATEDAIAAIVARGVSAVAIKTVYAPPISERVRDLSVQHGVPVYLYDGAYHEMVAYQALDLIRRDEQESDCQNALDDLLSEDDSETLRDRLHDVTGLASSRLMCAAFAWAAGAPDRCTVRALLALVKGELADLARRGEGPAPAFACRYHDTVLLVAGVEQPGAATRLASWARHFTEGHVSLRCGLGDDLSAGEGVLSIRQALSLCALHAGDVRPFMTWVDAGFRAFAATSEQNALMRHTCMRFQDLIAQEDGADGSLAATARAFAASFGDVSEAAERLFQHPNTVRYRLRKLKTALLMSEVTDRELAAFLTLVFLAGPEGRLDRE
ncbi:PucR family transcriptional regulator [Eggerthellaceae bacterium zg-1084]|uniref:PucR family transcriptional regulator n=1 Tax=Berryella wangjianweii TaxID=2734634 RepID=A0A6M8J1Q6_9ACTN|nr:PucR family transcriptional regulator [Berryella wangjianweii]NPD31497.1 PucR family transcriptional regulator [Berryella wangjianweii]QKF07880.1 PucR family transcriptional regulator [Berryella wangjianweii]